eukprot:scaffold97954_cov51-Prasinocladus_malaysianus.AAC.2
MHGRSAAQMSMTRDMGTDSLSMTNMTRCMTPRNMKIAMQTAIETAAMMTEDMWTRMTRIALQKAESLTKRALKAAEAAAGGELLAIVKLGYASIFGLCLSYEACMFMPTTNRSGWSMTAMLPGKTNSLGYREQQLLRAQL